MAEIAMQVGGDAKRDSERTLDDIGLRLDSVQDLA